MARRGQTAIEISRLSAAACRYCGATIDRVKMTDGRIIAANPGDGDPIRKSHWKTCKEMKRPDKPSDARFELLIQENTEE